LVTTGSTSTTGKAGEEGILWEGSLRRVSTCERRASSTRTGCERSSTRANARMSSRANRSASSLRVPQAANSPGGIVSLTTVSNGATMLSETAEPSSHEKNCSDSTRSLTKRESDSLYYYAAMTRAHQKSNSTLTMQFRYFERASI